jgi:hypothetical protein
MNKPQLITIALSAAALTFVAGGASASSLIGSGQIKDDSVRSVDIQDGTLHGRDLSDDLNAKLSQPGPKGDTGAQGVQGPAGAKGEAGDAAFKGAYRSVAFYDSGDTNGGAIATVACQNPTDYAISGGVQTLGIDGGTASPVASSFAGRMDWSVSKPFPNRHDGWIVQFAGAAPLKAKVFAVCVPGIDVPDTVTYIESN